MALERTALEHAANMVRRQIQDEVADLTLLFVVHDNPSRLKTLTLEEPRILEHPAGEAALRVLKEYTKDNKTRFLGLAEGTQRKKLSFKRQPFFLGLYFVNAHEFDTMENAREHLYHLAWHSIELLECYKKQNNNYKLSKGIITPKHTAINLSKNNLSADVFSAVTLELQGNTGTIVNLAHKRAAATLNATPGYKAEQYPYIISLETTQQVFDELKQNFNAKIRISGHAKHVAKEVVETLTDQPIKQWWNFCTRAQEMAWMGSLPDDILTAALYGSEDPYTRSIAYLIAESLDIKPKTLSATGNYNPFSDQEANERLHNKICEESFQAALSQAKATDYYHTLIREAHIQNQRLAQGHPAGWCARAMLNAAAACKGADPANAETAQTATKIFHETKDNTPWRIIENTNEELMKRRRMGHEITTAALEHMSKKSPGLSLFAHTFKTAETHYKKLEARGVFRQYPFGKNSNEMINAIENNKIIRYGDAFRKPIQNREAEDA